MDHERCRRKGEETSKHKRGNGRHDGDAKVGSHDTKRKGSKRQMSKRWPENVVFSGGGVKGALLAGALHVLDVSGYRHRVKTWAGTSIGSLVAALAAVGYTGVEICQMFIRLEPADYLDVNPGLITVGGITTGEGFVRWLGGRIEERLGRPDVTLAELHAKTGQRFVCMVTCLSKPGVLELNPETHGDLELRMAVRMSIGIPMLFTPIPLDGEMYVDGGLLDNFALHRFPAERSLGINLFHARSHRGPIAVWQVPGLLSQSIGSFLESVMFEEHEEGWVSRHHRAAVPHRGKRHFSLTIDYPEVSSLNFSVNLQQKIDMILMGQASMFEWFLRHDLWVWPYPANGVYRSVAHGGCFREYVRGECSLRQRLMEPRRMANVAGDADNLAMEPVLCAYPLRFLVGWQTTAIEDPQRVVDGTRFFVKPTTRCQLPSMRSLEGRTLATEALFLSPELLLNFAPAPAVAALGKADGQYADALALDSVCSDFSSSDMPPEVSIIGPKGQLEDRSLFRQAGPDARDIGSLFPELAQSDGQRSKPQRSRSPSSPMSRSVSPTLSPRQVGGGGGSGHDGRRSPGALGVIMNIVRNIPGAKAAATGLVKQLTGL